MGNWANEFEKWFPCCKAVKLIATADQRENILKNIIRKNEFDVILTSYEGV